VPNQPRTPNRSIRIPDEIFVPASERAKAEGRTLSDVVRELLSEYIDDNKE
jgi:predicted DNA-binding protein